MGKKRKKAKIERENREFLAELNEVQVSGEDLAQVSEQSANLPPEQKNFMGGSLLVIRYTNGNALKATVIQHRLSALAGLLGEEGIQGWTLPKQPDGTTMAREELFAAAATLPLIEKDGKTIFDREKFLEKALEISEPEGNG